MQALLFFNRSYIYKLKRIYTTMNYEENLRDKVLESADKTDEIASRLENAMNAGEAEGIDYPAPRRLSL